MTRNTLDEWEAEARCTHHKTENVKWRDERILILIDLVRKKDETLKWCADQCGYASPWQIKLSGALALTEDLE